MVMKGTATVTSKGDPNILKKIMADLGKLEVYVGIPEEEASREGENKNEGINNAELAYIHTHGIRAGSMREEMQPNMNKGMPYSKAYEMYVQEHGSPLWHSPPRPIIESAIEKHKDKIADKLKPALKARLNGDEQGAREGLEKAGMFASGKVKDFFTDPENGWAPNTPKTIEEKGSDRPLVDTGSLRQAITYVVGEK
ncbi:hypothetical protein SOV_04730 [Sporomusa ovata DSM 2662]|uniref:Uncharacterized protein n=1 Tax=Sporomusa ovata TaxID=2378 RepID=A0A0U1KW83_9FIRM|nr:hypothetical protein [Sporomusa ovata]EQB28143.1 hypothetical protein SOV_2c10660 [Sporomusa ovata DSM 2662]CQR71677.1 hypothetical protein SpAn4DRAFT_3543 [Sporomusa ovata]